MVKSKSDIVFDAVVFLIILFVGVVCLVPILYVVSVSLTPIAEKLRAGGFLLIPHKVTFTAYEEVLANKAFINALLVSLRLTIVGTFLNLVVTMLFAYPLSRKNLPGGKVIMRLVVFTMVFSAGMVPTYLVVKQMNLLNTFWAMVVPGMVNVYNFIIMKSFFEGLPDDLFEAARIDGASEFTVLTKIVLPLSLPIIMTIGLYYAVDHWNAYMVAVLYVTKDALQPLQVVLRRILRSANSAEITVDEIIPTETLQMASVVLSTLPIVIIYPFIQKYFVKGTLAGAVKG
jgi:putative aldouronate transport system permease protein